MNVPNLPNENKNSNLKNNIYNINRKYIFCKKKYFFKTKAKFDKIYISLCFF